MGAGGHGSCRVDEAMPIKPGDYNLAALNTLLDQVIAWSAALAPLRMTADIAA